MGVSARRAVLALAAACLLATAPAARGYDTAPRSSGNPDFASVITAIVPRTPGLRAHVLGHDNLVELVNRTRQPVVVEGYNHEPYARLLADGTVQLNLRSPAFYRNEYRFGDQTVPAYADPRAAPEWRTMDHSGRLSWHDHRAHWRRAARPPGVGRRRKLLFTYRIPIAVGARRGALGGELWWIGDHGQTSAVMYALPVAALGGVALAARGLGRRRRRPT